MSERDAIVAVTDADREAYLSLNMLPGLDAADVRAGRWDKLTGMQVMARHRATHAGEVKRLREENDALRRVYKWWSRWPEWVPDPKFTDEVMRDLADARQALESSR